MEPASGRRPRIRATGDLPVLGRLTIPAAELQWRFSRGSGPGGQGVNTTDSRVELSFDITTSTALGPEQRDRLLHRLEDRVVDGVVTVVSAESRSQLQNRTAARTRLAALLRDALRPDPPTRRPTTPSRAARSRRRDEKRNRGQIKALRGRVRRDE